MANTGPIPWRVEKLERFTDDVSKTLIDLRETIINLDNRIKVHDESRRFWAKVWLAVVSAVAVTLMVFLARISFIVQSNKLP